MYLMVLLLLLSVGLQAGDLVHAPEHKTQTQHFFDAIRDGQSEIIKKYVASNQTIPYGALTSAVINKKENLVAMFIECGADVNELVDIELASGGPQELERMGCECTKAEYNGLHQFPCRRRLCHPLHIACYMGNSSLLALFKHYKSPIMAAITNSSMLLYDAIDGRSEEVILDLINEPGSVINIQNDYGNSPLHVAIPWSSCAVVESLLKHGANASKRNDRGRTPLHIAVKKGLVDKVKLLIPYSDLNAQDNEGLTPLLQALASGCRYSGSSIHSEIALLLVSSLDDPGMRPLYGAVKNGQKELVAYLLAKGADPLALDPEWGAVFDCDFKANPKIEELLFNTAFPEANWHS